MSLLTDRKKRIALEHWYLTDGATAVPARVPSHRYWQCPFVFPPVDHTIEKMQRRVELAGRLWLRNFDLGSFARLVIAHTEIDWSYVIARHFSSDAPARIVGPLNERILDRGKSLFAYPLIYREL